MTPFLRQVAEHYYALGDMERSCFIFPNKRAVVFFRKYLASCAGAGGRAMLSPRLLTMNEFFYGMAGASPTGQVRLLLELFDCYARLNPAHETLDEFIFWGNVLLSDFDDVDKYLVEPGRLFRNIADFRSLQDGMEYLDEGQRAAIERFVSHFSTGGRYKDEFRRIWDILLPLYQNFNTVLSEKGFSYEGRVYRELACRLKEESAADVASGCFADTDKFIFVGLNALNECEKFLMRKFRDAGLAEFCWDYRSGWIRDVHNKSSFFMARNVEEFPPAFVTDPDGLPLPEFNIVSVPSSVGQAKQLPAIFERTGAVGIETAVVLPDETMLMPVLNSIPEHMPDINVTMGYPMASSELWSLMNEIGAMQMHLREKDGKWFFYHRQVWSIFSNGIFKTVSGEDGAARMAAIKQSARYYISQEELSGNPVFELIFRPVVKTADVPDSSLVEAIEDYQCSILSGIAPLLAGNEDMAVELEFAKEYYLAVGQLRSCSLSILPATYFRLVGKLVSGISVPFKGEPLKGLQILGPLETRALDFDNIVILGCNEGIFPRRNVSSSFIPPELRKGFGLPTYEYQDAVWAYYFYRMIQRAGKVWMLFDSRTEGTRSGEESRYIKQLELHFGAKVNRHVARSPLERLEEEDVIPKTEEHVRIMREKYLSASSLQKYLACSAQFYYYTVCGLRASDDVTETLDSGMIGSVFHAVMQELYTVPGGIVTKTYLKSLAGSGLVKDKVRRLIMEELHSFEVTGRNLIFEDMVCRYVDKVIQRDMGLMDSMGKDSFRIIGLELKRYARIGDFNFIGIIDRLDSFTPGEVRIVDYKTGKVTDNDFVINDDNADKVVSAVFGEDNDKRPKIALQLYLYDRILSEGGDGLVSGKHIVNSVYQTSRLFVREIENVALSGRFLELMRENLDMLLDELADTSVPFRRTENVKTCEYCDFKSICGR